MWESGEMCLSPQILFRVNLVLGLLDAIRSLLTVYFIGVYSHKNVRADMGIGNVWLSKGLKVAQDNMVYPILTLHNY